VDALSATIAIKASVARMTVSLVFIMFSLKVRVVRANEKSLLNPVCEVKQNARCGDQVYPFHHFLL
jgi:hypothetical protein